MLSEEMLTKLDRCLDNWQYPPNIDGEIGLVKTEIENFKSEIANRIYDANNHLFDVADELKKIRECMERREEVAATKRRAVEEFSLFG